jgi:hypothetical protein
LHELENRIELVKPKYNGLFDEFKLIIDTNHNIERILKMIVFLKGNSDAGKILIISELEKLLYSLGEEQSIERIEKEIEDKYQFNKTDAQNNALAYDLGSKIDLEIKVNNIFDRISKTVNAEIKTFSSVGQGELTEVIVNKKKLIFQGKPSTGNDLYLENVGAGGEEEVLCYFINEFLEIKGEEKRKDAITAVHDLIKIKLGNDSHEKYKTECLKVLDNDVNLKKALIPFFYIALNHKFSYVDLIVLKDGIPTVIEVKTTQNKNNDAFYISTAEVNEARNEPNYEIIRVTPTEILFMGNPIREISDKITYIKGSNYHLIPRNYKFEFNKPESL